MNVTTCFFRAWGHYLAGNKNSCKEWLDAALHMHIEKTIKGMVRYISKPITNQGDMLS